MSSDFSIHPQKLYLHPLQPIEKDEKQRRSENIFRYIREIVENNGTKAVDSDTSNQLIYRIVLKDKMKQEHVIQICFSSIQQEELSKRTWHRGECEKLQRVILDSESYVVDKAGAGKIWDWLFDSSSLDVSEDLVLPLKGNKMEVINHAPMVTLSDECWSTHFYRKLYTEIHLSLLAYAKQLVHDKTDILELCCGNGALAQQIIANTTPNSYTLIDRNREMLTRATQTLQEHIVSGKTKIVSCDLSTTPLNNAVDGSFDLIMGCGALTWEVLSQETSISVLAQAYEMLKKGGHLILSGVEYSWVDSDMLLAAGFTVLNSFCPQTGKHLYVAQKQ